MSNKSSDRFDGVLLGKLDHTITIRITIQCIYKNEHFLKTGLCYTSKLSLGVAQDCEGGVQEMLDVIFGFLARKTDFYASGLEDGKAKDLIDAAFKKHSASAEEEAAKKKVLLL